MIEKIGRNDQCLCGSGRKYKRCCSNQVVQMDTFIETELNDIQLNFMRWAMQEYKQEIREHLTPYYQAMNIPKEAEETLNFFSSLWYITSVKRDGTTILEDYLEKQVPQIEHTRIQEIVRLWRDAQPSVFIVRNWAPDGYVVIEDAFTADIRWVKLLDPKNHPHREEGIGIGTILPIERGGYAFFTTFFYVPTDLEEARDIADDLAQQLEEAGVDSLSYYMSISFMEVLQYFMFGKKLDMVETETTTQDPSADRASDRHTKAEIEAATATEEAVLTDGQKEVLDAYEAYTSGREHTDVLQEFGRRWWTTYAKRANPIVRKPQVAAAALYYLIDTVCLAGEVTQAGLARDFVISATSISSRYTDMVDVLQEEIAAYQTERAITS